MANTDNIFLLSKYQMKVLYYKCKEGATHEQIAQILGRDVNTVQYHMTKIYKILEISKPGKSKEEMDSELKNEICPIIRQLLNSVDDVKLWAPVIKKPSNGQIEHNKEDGQEQEGKEKPTPEYQPPPSLEKVLKQYERQSSPPQIIEPPPPGRANINWRRILIWAGIGIVIFFGLRFLTHFPAQRQGRPDSLNQPANTEPAPMIESPDIPTSTSTITPSITVTLTAIPTATPTPISIVTEISPKDGMVLVKVPAGEFKMGSSRADDPQTLDEELPQHIVFLDAYWIDQTEVTNKQYGLCVKEGACTRPAQNNSLTRGSYYDELQFATFPVIFVSWSQAAEYCAWAGRRLPTEAEWEKAARGPEGRIFPWGNTFDGTLANYCDINCVNGWKDNTFDDGYIDTSPVGDYPAGASVYGAFDLAGNVYEWVADWYAPYNRTDQVNPTGPATGNERIIRGGSWGDDIGHIRAAVRSHVTPDYWMNFIGFRCACDQN